MRGYDKSPVTPPLHSSPPTPGFVTPDSRICHPRLPDLSPSTPGFVTPDSIGGPCLQPSNTMDTRMRGYDKIVVRPYCGKPPL